MTLSILNESHPPLESVTANSNEDSLCNRAEFAGGQLILGKSYCLNRRKNYEPGYLRM
jgi:hypothetical protein